MSTSRPVPRARSRKLGRRMAERWIVGMGGGGDDEDSTRTLVGHALSLSGSERPRVVLVPTAAADDPVSTLRMYELLRGRVELEHLPFFPWPPEDARDRLLHADAVFVQGGNTA